MLLGNTNDARQMNLVMTFLGHTADLKLAYPPNIKRFTTQTVATSDVVFMCFYLSYYNHVPRHVISYVIFM